MAASIEKKGHLRGYNDLPPTYEQIDRVQNLVPPPWRTAQYERLKTDEINHPESVLCSSCCNFHGRPSTFSIWGWRALNGAGSYPGMGSPARCAENRHSIRLANSRGTLTYWFVHMVMRNYRLGPQFGHDLDKDTFKSVFSSKHWTCVTSINVHDGRLLIRTTSYSRLQLGSDRSYLSNMPSCQHLYNSRGLVSMVAQKIGEFAGATVCRPVSSDLYACTRCPTEYRASVGPCNIVHATNCDVPVSLSLHTSNEADADTAVVLCQWMDLGPCESSASREWLSLAAPSGKWPVRQSFPFDLESRCTIAGRFEKLANGSEERKTFSSE